MYHPLRQPRTGRPLRSLVLPARALAPGGENLDLAIKWLQDFKNACTGCHFDFVAIHHYNCHCNSETDCNADSLKQYIDSVYEMWQKPIWLTEFNCGDGKRHA